MAPDIKFIVYSASAGSGKTFTLVKNYLLLLLKSNRSDAFKNILAITFTNKAVAEMKTRVIERLLELSETNNPASNSLMEKLVEESGLEPEEITNKAKSILKGILHNYAAFEISTIDRFTHKIIRTFARDLGIPTNFEVELNTDLVLQEAVDKLIEKAGKDELLTKILLDYTLSKTDDDKSWDISRDLFQFSKLLVQENHLQYVLPLKEKKLSDFKTFGKKIKKEIEQCENLISLAAERFFEICNKECLEKGDFSRGSVHNYFGKIFSGDYSIIWGAAWQNNIEEVSLYPSRLSAQKKEILDQKQQEIADLFKLSRDQLFKREYLKEIYKNLTPLSLLSALALEVEAIKKERSLVLISDFNPTISKEIYNQPAPFIYERLGERFSNYFIDEFQDTSQMQWENIIPLIDNALSGGLSSSLTLVGDAKQSIYRFRGGKAEQFIELCKSKNPFQVEKEVTDLPANYRSAANIVRFNNRFFNYVSQKFENEDYSKLFASGHQDITKKEEGFVNISFLECENAAQENELHPQKVLEILKETEEKGIGKGDICILTRTRKQSVNIAACLTENGIPIVSSESLLVKNSPEVLFIDSLLRFSLNPDDKLQKLKIFNYLFEKLQIKNQYEVVIKNLENDDQHFFDWLKEFDIYFDINQLRFFSIYEGIETIIRQFQLIKSSNSYLQFYLDFAFEFTSSNSGDISGFLDFWDQKKEKLSIIAPKTGNAVQVMTIHQSKGLEFPVVIYPFANTKLKDTRKDYLWLELPERFNEIPVGYFKASRNMENWGSREASAYNNLIQQNEFDNINILYVAFTRAAKQLYVISNYDLDKNEEEKGDLVSGLLIGYLKSVGKWTGETSYSFGKSEEIKANHKSINSAHPAHYFSSPTSNQAVQLVTKEGVLWDSLQQSAIEKGNMVHKLLSEINTSEDVAAAFEKIQLKGFSSEEIKSSVLKVVEHPKLKDYFSKTYKIEKERDIISGNGEILRPDRLNFLGEKVSIIDYKTGNPSASHLLQMEKYEQVLKQMDFEVVQKILIYIGEDINIQFV